MSDETICDPAEPVVTAGQLLWLIQDTDICEARIRSLLEHSENACRLPLSQLTGLRPMLRAIQEGVLMDEILAGRISVAEFSDVAQHPDGLWAVHNTMLEVLDLESSEDSPASGSAAQKLRLIYEYSTAPPSKETAVIAGADTEAKPFAPAQPSPSSDLTDPLPWLLLWQQSEATLRIQNEKWKAVLRDAMESRRRIAGNRPVTGDVCLGVAIESLIQHHMRSEPLTSAEFNWDSFTLQTACDIVLGREQSGVPSWEIEVKASLLRQKAMLQDPMKLYFLKIAKTIADHRTLDLLLTRLGRELQLVRSEIQRSICDNVKSPAESADVPAQRQV